MRPLNADGTAWGIESTQLALRTLKSKCKNDLHDMEERESGGRLNAENRYSPVIEVMRDKDNAALGSVRHADPVLASIKHTGQELESLLKSRWATFCESPQDEQPYLDQMIKALRTDAMAVMKSDGETIEERLGGLTPRMSAPEPSAERITSGMMPLPPVAQAETVADASTATVVVEASPVKKRAWKRGDRGRPPKGT